MDFRVGLVVLLVLAGNMVCDARSLSSSDVLGSQNGRGVIDVCTMCEQYTTLALDYLQQNKTQNEVIEALHKACFQLHGLAEQCTMLVNYYAPLFFLEVQSVEPQLFCQKVELCKNKMVFSLPEKKDACDLCHKAVDEALEKLEDPDTQLEVIQILLKACNSVGHYKKKCKSMVFEFGPIILTDAQKFLDDIDLCTTFHACSKHKIDTEQGKIEMVTSS